MKRWFRENWDGMLLVFGVGAIGGVFGGMAVLGAMALALGA
jgi:hypothetical protein